MSVYDLDGDSISAVYDINGSSLSSCYDIDGDLIWRPWDQFPSGTLTANSVAPLPDLYEVGKGFTCTGLAYDANTQTYLVGDIGILLPNSGTIQSKIVRLSYDFTTVIETIPLYTTFPSMGEIQGITIDTSDGTIWFCAPTANKVYHISASGQNLGSFALNGATGISYDSVTDSFWTMTYSQMAYNLSKSGAVIKRFDLSNMVDTLDQCYYDAANNILFFDAGDNFSSANNLYMLDTLTGSVSIACVLTDSYAVEGISLESNRLVVLNDGYYHSATTSRNQANIYNKPVGVI